MEITLVNKNIVITGASSGIGKAIAIECSASDANVIITGRNEERLNDTFLRLNGSRNIKMLCDLTDITSLQTFVDSLPQLDGIIFCAGTTHTAPAKFNDNNSIDLLFNTNILSSIRLMRLLLKYKKLNYGSSVIFISSLASIKPYKGNSLYSATKGAINSYSKVLALELSSQKIRVNCILPGIIRTKDVTIFSEEEMSNQEIKIPLGFGNVQDIANSCVFLLSEKSRWITGSEIIIDGGQSIN